jgi:hypothetical protein
VQGLPILLVRNSYSFTSAVEFSNTTGISLDPSVTSEDIEIFPAFKFAIWPYGYYAFLNELVYSGEWASAFRVCEVLDRDDFISNANALLFDIGAQRLLANAQADYIARVKALPEPAVAITSDLHIA